MSKPQKEIELPNPEGRINRNYLYHILPLPLHVASQNPHGFIAREGRRQVLIEPGEVPNLVFGFEFQPDILVSPYPGVVVKAVRLNDQWTVTDSLVVVL